MKKRKIKILVAICLAVIAVLAACTVGDFLKVYVQNPKEAPRRTPRSCGSSFVEITTGVPIVHLYGKPYERGFAHGQLLKDEIEVMLTNYLDIVAKYSGGQKYYHDIAARMTPYIPDRYMIEMKGIAAGANIELERVVIANCFLDISQNAYCSTFALSTYRTVNDIGPMLGRNLDFPHLNIADKFSHIFVHHPRPSVVKSGKDAADELGTCYAFASISWPGLIGVLSGMNSEGLALSMMLVRSDAEEFDGIPYSMVFRQLLENCSSTDAALKRLKNLTKRATVTTNLIMLDSSSQAVVTEIIPRANGRGGYHLRKSQRGCIYATNHFVLEHEGLELDAFTDSYDRWRLLEENLKGETKIDTAAAEDLLQFVSVPGETLQSMIFLPDEMKLILAAEGSEAADGPFYEYDLKAMIEKTASRSHSR